MPPQLPLRIPVDKLRWPEKLADTKPTYRAPLEEVVRERNVQPDFGQIRDKVKS
jgi:hypothetical protein